MEFYENVKVKKLEWGEDLAYLSNKYCPFCGREFELYDEVIEVVTKPIVKIFNDEELDCLEIAIHLKCLLKVIKGENEDP